MRRIILTLSAVLLMASTFGTTVFALLGAKSFVKAI
jgi:hypothetical protein